jgi:hypothetical protein
MPAHHLARRRDRPNRAEATPLFGRGDQAGFNRHRKNAQIEQAEFEYQK